MPRVIAFDVNETLLDLSPLDPLFERAFGDAAMRATWFSQMLQLGFVGGLTGRYVDFPSAQRAALTMVAETTGAEARAEHYQSDPALALGCRCIEAHAAKVRPGRREILNGSVIRAPDGVRAIAARTTPRDRGSARSSARCCAAASAATGPPAWRTPA
jgi:hypothetical protein